MDKNHSSAAHRLETTIHFEERKDNKGRSAQNVCDQIEGEYGVKISVILSIDMSKMATLDLQP